MNRAFALSGYRLRYIVCNDRSYYRDRRENYVVDVDNFVILSLMGERGRPYHHRVSIST